MSLKDITNKIIEDAQAESAKIADETRAETALAAKKKDEEIAVAVRTIEKRGAEKAAKIREQAEFRARMIEKNAVLKAKQESIDEVIDAVKKKLSALDNDDFVRLMVSALKESPRVEGAQVITSAGKKNLMSRAISEAKMPYELSDRILPAGQEGFILSSKTVEVNNTIESIVDSRREALEPEIVKRLFG